MFDKLLKNIQNAFYNDNNCKQKNNIKNYSFLQSFNYLKVNQIDANNDGTEWMFPRVYEQDSCDYASLGGPIDVELMPLDNIISHKYDNVVDRFVRVINTGGSNECDAYTKVNKDFYFFMIDVKFLCGKFFVSKFILFPVKHLKMYFSLIHLKKTLQGIISIFIVNLQVVFFYMQFH